MGNHFDTERHQYMDDNIHWIHEFRNSKHDKSMLWFVGAQAMFAMKMIFPECSVVIGGAPTLSSGAPWHVVGRPSLTAGTPRWSRVNLKFTPVICEVPKLITLSPMVFIFQSSKIPVTLKVKQMVFPWFDSLLKFSEFSLHSTSSPTILETSCD
jgi:hypothetical protein